MDRKIEKSEVSQTINLREIYGRSPTLEEKFEFADMVKNEIIDRTQQGKNINGRDFSQYSPEYAEFKGVSRDDVDLTFFGDMLQSIQTEVSGDNVTVKISDNEQAIKAFAHVTGYEGHPTIKNGPKRDFFGVTNQRAKELAEQVKVVQETPGLLDILGAAPTPDIPAGLSISQILAQIGLTNGEG